MRLKYNADTQTISVPEVKGVTYLIDGEPVTGDVYIEETTVVTAEPRDGAKFTEGAKTSWTFEVEPADTPPQ